MHGIGCFRVFWVAIAPFWVCATESLALSWMGCTCRFYKMHKISTMETGPSLNGTDNITWCYWTFIADSSEALPVGISNVSSFLDLTQLVRVKSREGLSGNDSDSNQSDSDSNRIPANMQRLGLFARFETFEDLQGGFPNLLVKFPKKALSKSSEPLNALHIVVMREASSPMGSESSSERLRDFLRLHSEGLKEAGVRRVTFLVSGVVGGLEWGLSELVMEVKDRDGPGV